MLFQILLFFGCLLVISLIYGITKYVFDMLRYSLPPGPIPLPIVGNLVDTAVDPINVKFWRRTRDMSLQYGPIMRLYFGQYRVIILQSAEIIHEALVKQSKTFNWRIQGDVAGYKKLPIGIVSANFEDWTRRRRFCTTAMRNFSLHEGGMAVKIHNEIGPIMDYLVATQGQPFDIKPLFKNAISNVMCSIVLGHRFNLDDEYFQELQRRIDGIFEANRAATVSNVLLMMFPFTEILLTAPSLINMLPFAEMLNDLLEKSIKEHRLDFDAQHLRDFPDVFIASQLTGHDELRFEEFCNVMQDMFMAGSETTSTTLSWTILYLATFERVQRKAHNAIDRVIDTDRLPEMADRANLVYLDAIFNETLRHATIAPMALYHSNKATAAKLAGYDIPPYSIIIYNVAAIHRDSKYWQNADDFEPDRWIDPETGKLLSHGIHFMPFGIGPRICLGESLARIEHFLIMTALLYRFKFRLETTVDLESGRQGMVHTVPSFRIIAESR